MLPLRSRLRQITLIGRYQGRRGSSFTPRRESVAQAAWPLYLICPSVCPLFHPMKISHSCSPPLNHNTATKLPLWQLFHCSLSFPRYDHRHSFFSSSYIRKITQSLLHSCGFEYFSSLVSETVPGILIFSRDNLRDRSIISPLLIRKRCSCRC